MDINYFELKKINTEKEKNGDLKQINNVWTMPITQSAEQLRKKMAKRYILHKNHKNY